MTLTRGQRISVGRATVQGVFLRSRGPLALVLLDVRHKPTAFLLSSCKPAPPAEEKIVQLFHVER